MFIGCVMVNMFTSCVVDHVFIGGVMVNMFTSCVVHVDHVFIGGVMVNKFAWFLWNIFAQLTMYM